MLPLYPASSLQDLRDTLLKINGELLLTISRRREIGELIQNNKSQADSYPNFDPSREVEVFRHMIEELKHLSLKELLAFSLIMEDQAKAPSLYPAWSSGIHLEGPVTDLSEMINPILLKMTHPHKFQKLSFKAEFLELLNQQFF